LRVKWQSRWQFKNIERLVAGALELLPLQIVQLLAEA